MKLRFRALPALFLLLGQAALAEPFTAEQLVRLHRVGAPVVSPDGTQVAYSVRETDMDSGKGRFDLWISSLGGGKAKRLTQHDAADTEPAWSRDGKWVYFLSARSGSSQVWRISPGGGAAAQVTDLPLDVGSYRLSPAGDLLVLSMRVYPDCKALSCTVERDEKSAQDPTTGMRFEDLFVRHWDRWLDPKISRLFMLPLKEDGPAGAAVLLSGDVVAEVPSRTWGGREEYVISPDGETLYFTARLRNGSEAWSTNFDIWSIAVDGSSKAVNLTAANKARDTQPVLSPDGSQLAWLAMRRAGFEADRYRIMVRDLSSGAAFELAPDWDRSPSSIAFSGDGKSIYANAQDMGEKTLWRFDLDTGAAHRLTGGGTISSFDVSSGPVVFARDNLRSPSELFILEGGETRQLTDFTGPQLEGTEMGEYQRFSFEGAHGDTVHGYVMKPADYEEGKQYPVAFLIHGGPQGSFGDHWHYRWNPQTYAGQGFASVFIDFHGSTGYGQAFTDSISGDWGGAPLLDLQLGLAAAIEAFDFLDGERACALGASYGGYMVNWIAGNWPERFNCLVNHDGIFDARMMYYATEELWFPEWEHGGPYHADPEEYEKHNPVNFLQHWKTPMLVVHGELDYRVPVTQGIATFTALRRLGIPAQFLYFPDENHWVLNAHNSIQWHETVNAWLHRHLETGSD